MTRLTQSDIIRAQEARIDSLTLMVEKLTVMIGEVLAALTEDKQPRTASETVGIDRSGTGSNATIIKIGAVAKEDESLDDALARAGAVFEKATARYPLPNGLTHPHPLGKGHESAPEEAKA
jgi:hypothetical protein